MIRAIRADTDIVVTLSLGEYPAEVYRRWHNAGAERYLLKFELIGPGAVPAPASGLRFR
ncbi:MAG: hypothetical protein U5N56_12750 [Candidatus Marinimicrobia bacterium]|nr:hypothetical protein [Candidatus Neomarinimicrobiota bacterium]